MIDEEMIRMEILNGLQQVDNSFSITDFFMKYNNETRSLNISFVAETSKGETVSEVINYA